MCACRQVKIDLHMIYFTQSCWTVQFNVITLSQHCTIAVTSAVDNINVAVYICDACGTWDTSGSINMHVPCMTLCMYLWCMQVITSWAHCNCSVEHIHVYTEICILLDAASMWMCIQYLSAVTAFKLLICMHAPHIHRYILYHRCMIVDIT